MNVPLYTDNHKALKDEIISFTELHLNDGMFERDSEQVFDRGLWQKFGKLKLQGLPVPTKYGGKGYDALSTMVALEALGYGCRDNGLSFALGAHLLSCVVPIWIYGTETQKKKLLPFLCDGSWVASNAITEASSGSDVFKMRTLAKKQHDGYLLNGEKSFCSNGPIADIVLAYAVTDEKRGMMGGISAFLLRRSSKHFDAGSNVDKLGLRTSEMGSLYFNDIQLSENELLGKEGGGMLIFSKSMIWERIGLSAIHLGTLHRLFRETLEGIKARKFEYSFTDRHQAISHQLVNIKIELETSRLLIYQAANLLSEGNTANLYACMAKIKTSELYKKASGDLLNICSYFGCGPKEDLERTFRDATSSTIYSGTSEVLRNVVSKYLNL